MIKQILNRKGGGGGEGSKYFVFGFIVTKNMSRHMHRFYAINYYSLVFLFLILVFVIVAYIGTHVCVCVFMWTTLQSSLTPIIYVKCTHKHTQTKCKWARENCWVVLFFLADKTNLLWAYNNMCYVGTYIHICNY